MWQELRLLLLLVDVVVGRLAAAVERAVRASAAAMAAVSLAISAV